MKKRRLLILLLIVLLTACSIHKVIIPETLIDDEEKISKLNKTPIQISTKDSVLHKLKSETSNKFLLRKKVLKNWPIINYSFSNDTLYVDDIDFEAGIALSKIENIKCKGVWDDEIGFISEEEILDYNKGGLKAVGGALLGVVGGLFLGGALVGVVSGSIADEKFFGGIAGCAAGAALGAILGGIFGYYAFTPNYTLEVIIQKIKADRKSMTLKVRSGSN